MTPLLEVTGLSKTFGAREVLADVSFAIEPGETLAVIGPSGAGKSTLLRCINLLERPTAGRVVLDGDELTAHGRSERELAQVRRRVGMVFQSFNLFPHRSALENVVLAQVHALGRGRAEAELRGLELLARVGLSERAANRPRQLSGGEQQRVAIARALALDPALLLLDEPTSAIDPELKREVLAVVRDLVADGMTMVLTTHEMRFAEEAADRVLFMADGRIVEEGAAATVMRAPAHERTRRFLSAVRDL
ncbi:amino acid ABC transporter ATP-binding protein [Conexibacter stalactiti]|uniref:Amino acid ABC transporter ATP-binding protein n=1 Tax=Conexibacter stalactiti TaxID=1940611 RepID=A0ABU4HP44_9ACTN|nr:amino acid ABC transporter ATP-binding protein [Conexibacter stalactiti]MDW5595066.1 amino acid ABC transporter ATP-binding protein [Conexibacter stalactiti]MEC5035708.1 amino acid ABC transporter ATP-binding protein [Conexibacter stalactiti]